MGTLQEAVNKMLDELPHMLLSSLIDEKLREQNIKLSKRKLDALTQRVLSEKTDTLQFGSRNDVMIEFTDEDTERLSAKAERSIERLPKIIESQTDTAAVDILAALKLGWRKEAAQQRRDINGFRKRLEERWGSGLELLRMLTTIAREFGDNINKDVGSAGGGDR